MRYALRFLLFLVVCFAVVFSGVTASAATSTLKCNSQKDTIWVYGSLATLEVQAKLNCGETVEVLDRVNGYVKVRTQHGIEGYVPESDFSDLPANQSQPDATHDVGYVAKAVQAREIAKVEAANAAFVVPNGNGASASSRTPTSEPAAGARPNSSAPSMLPNTMAEMAPRTRAAPVKNAAASNPVPAAETATVATSKPLDTAAAPKPARLPAPVAAAAHPTDPEDDVDEVPEYKLEPESQDPACRRYFSAYGLTANQLKWIAQNRKKAFPSICPAADVSKVNYVIIFTHDVGFFGVTLPAAVHTLNGFSDFRPMNPEDNTLVSQSDSDKAHREYVWVFQLADGTFNPATFSPNRKVQFTKVETNSLGSKGGPKAVEDAFRFLESAGSSQ